MARAPNEKLNKALSLYQKGYKLVDIAKELDIPPGTVRRWKKTYNWDNSERSEKENDKSERSVSKKSKENEKKKLKEKAIAEEVKEVLENNELTDKQRLFCIYYNKCFNATKAYQKAYQVDYDTANAHGYKLLSNVVIKDELQKLKQAKLNRVMLSEDDIFQKYIDIGFADITDFLEFGNEEVDGEFGRYTRSYVNIKHSFEVDGTLISEVSQGKDGVKVKLQDKMRALQWLSDRMDLLPTATRIKLDNEQKKLDNILNKRDKDNSEKDDVLAKMLEGLRNGL
ncbi:MAG: terminase small subunit [Clostridium saudiense]|uniref:terminase small subunit n=1 Tax=Clostridium saudiense TaxID=1414720 RepID=UPI0029074D93|nr:terminase small subunit [Clostridium saudiense]MDU3520216.1 terminase small subunit [Clostridium saudiense]